MLGTTLRRNTFVQPGMVWKSTTYSAVGSAKSMATAARVVRRVSTRRTHFLTLPLYEGPGILSKMEELRQLWRQGAESASLEPGIIIPSIRHALSLKLGNINIKGAEPSTVTTVANPDARESQTEPPAFEREEVIKLMQGLKEPIRELLASHGDSDTLRVPLGGLTPLRHGKHATFNPRKVNVLFLRPTEGKGMDLVIAISRIVHERFTAAGMLAGSPILPAKPNLTLINTANRQSYVPAPGVSRKPFSLKALYCLDGFKAFRATELPSDLALPLKVDLGVAEVGKLELVRVMPGLPSDNTTILHEAEVVFST